jgi:hypothetical protein
MRRDKRFPATRDVGGYTLEYHFRQKLWGFLNFLHDIPADRALSRGHLKVLTDIRDEVNGLLGE